MSTSNLARTQAGTPDCGARQYVAIWIFVSLALGLAGLHALVFELAARGALGFDPPRDVLNGLRSYGPALAALVAIGYGQGRTGLRSLRDRLLRWRVARSTYAMAVAVPLVAMALALCTVAIAHGALAPAAEPRLGRLLLIFLVLPLLDGPLGEEIGWRGYLLPTLTRRHGVIVAAVAVAVVWYLWHLPLYFADGRELTAPFLGRYFVFMLALSFAQAWLFQRSGQSLVIAILFHNMTNYVVLVGFTLFPAVRGFPLYNDAYLLAMVGFGAFAALSLVRGGEKKSE